MKRDIFWRDGQLLHTLDGDAGEAWERIVVPKHRRADVLRMAHDHHMSGHLAHKKMVEHLKRLYTWPGIGVTPVTHVKELRRAIYIKPH